jgi:hypothetical protein
VRSGSSYLWRPHHIFTQADGCGANSPKPGYLAVILAEEGEIGSSDLWVVKDRLEVGKTAESGTPLKAFAYILFRIESSQHRDDVDGLTTINKPFGDSKTALISVCGGWIGQEHAS